MPVAFKNRNIVLASEEGGENVVECERAPHGSGIPRLPACQQFMPAQHSKCPFSFLYNRRPLQLLNYRIKVNLLLQTSALVKVVSRCAEIVQLRLYKLVLCTFARQKLVQIRCNFQEILCNHVFKVKKESRH